MLGFTSVSPVWVDVSARQRQIGRALRHQFETVATQAVPDQMLDLLRKADARFKAATGHDVHFSDGSTRLYSINIAIAIVGLLIVSWALYDVAILALAQPKLIIAAAFFAGLTATFAATAWLIEGE